VSALIDKEQVPVPEQLPPLHPEKDDPLLGAAVKVTIDPEL
jgi:hypothetical protein